MRSDILVKNMGQDFWHCPIVFCRIWRPRRNVRMTHTFRRGNGYRQMSRGSISLHFWRRSSDIFHWMSAGKRTVKNGMRLSWSSPGNWSSAFRTEAVTCRRRLTEMSLEEWSVNFSEAFRHSSGTCSCGVTGMQIRWHRLRRNLPARKTRSNPYCSV